MNVTEANEFERRFVQGMSHQQNDTNRVSAVNNSVYYGNVRTFNQQQQQRLAPVPANSSAATDNGTSITSGSYWTVQHPDLNSVY